MERERNMSAEGARDLMQGFLVGQVTRLEVARRADLWMSTVRLEDEDWPEGLLDALTELFPLAASEPPDPRSVHAALAALDLEPAHASIVLGISTRLVLLAVLLEPAEESATPDAILRPGERVLLGTAGGREALRALLDGRVDVLTSWLERTVLDPEAFLGTTWDVPLLDVGGLAGLVRRLVRRHGAAAARRGARDGGRRVGRGARHRLAARTTPPSARSCARSASRCWRATRRCCCGTPCRSSPSSPRTTPQLAERVLERCLPMSAARAGPLPGRPPPRRCSATSPWTTPPTCWTACRRSSDADAWDAVAREYLGRELAVHWLDWRPHVQRWATAPDRTRSAAVRRAVELAGTPEREALAWFADRG